ncbi:ABC transporter [Natrialba sp. PRR66]|uniref:ABC transporter n=1 Tax=Natrialba sp. PRR66 TaxID=3098146 RepID=UPI002B1D1435|nr:ABC transporter [Natrialba sp. PRR66]
MTNQLRLVAAVIEKRVVLLRRYWVNTLMRVVGMYATFAVVFLGGRSLGGADAEAALDVIVVGFFLFLATSAAYFDVAGSIMREAKWGTLEQLYLSPAGLGRIFSVTTVFNIVLSSGLALVLLALMVVTTGRSVSVDLLTVAPLLVVTILPAIGVGYAVAGLSLLYKRLENVQQLLRFGFAGLIAAPGAVQGPALAFLPVSPGSNLITLAMLDGTRLWEFPPTELVALFVTSTGYLVGGYLVFLHLVERTRDRGVMGHY